MKKFRLTSTIASQLSLMLALSILLSCCVTSEKRCDNDIASSFACRQAAICGNTLHNEEAKSIDMANVSELQQGDMGRQWQSDEVQGSVAEKRGDSHKIRNNISPVSPGRICICKIRVADGGILRHHLE